jgi:hypothetical protein
VLARGLLLPCLEALAEELIPPPSPPPTAGGHSFQEHEAPLVLAEVRASDRDSGAFGQVYSVGEIDFLFSNNLINLYMKVRKIFSEIQK